MRNWGIRVSVIEPGYTSTQIEANGPEADAQLDEYSEVRAVVGRRLTEMIKNGDSPMRVADVVLKSVSAARPKLRCTVGGFGFRLRLLRTFAPAWLVDAAIRKTLRLDAVSHEKLPV